MNVCVAGLWHLGSVIAACLAQAGHRVVGYDDVPSTVAALGSGRPPIFEPGLEELTRAGLAGGTLSFSSDPREALREADVLWVAWDTPVDAEDRALVDVIIGKIEALLPYVPAGALVLISSQLPVGTTARLGRAVRTSRPESGIAFACSPENLRLGKAIDAFMRPDRIVVGTERQQDEDRMAALLRPITDRIEWMSIESAEMTKHALNAFLATSVAFINEVATVCEHVGADARDVARGLKSDRRIGPGAYLSPGGAFSGGTLARDVTFLSDLAATFDQPLRLIPAARESNEAHRAWTARKLESELSGTTGRTIAVWGLTYKPGTDTLRRSAAVALCRALAASGAVVRAYDPAIRDRLPADVSAAVTLCGSPVEAVQGADALVVATEWPVFREVTAADVIAAGAPVVLDAGRFLSDTLGADGRLRYITVGTPGR